jgi:acyl-CoA synthetase (NDP forming)
MTAKPVPALARPEGRTVLTEIESKQFFEAAGLPVVETRLAETREEAVRLGRAMGFPIAMKVMSPEIIHKSDAGGVKLGLADVEELERAYEEIMASVVRCHPEARIKGVSVQKMARPGQEVIIGMSKDPELGPLLMFGLGGVMVGVMKDVSFRLVPMASGDAREMIREIRGYSLQKGFRGSGAFDIPVLEECCLNVAELIQGHPEIREMESQPGCRLQHRGCDRGCANHTGRERVRSSWK